MSNLVNTIIHILTASRTVTKTDRSTTGYDIACNGTRIWFFTESPQDERYDGDIPRFFSKDRSGLTELQNVKNVLTDAEKLELADWVKKNGHEWRVKDGDGELHGKGYYYGDDDESLFAPQNFISYNTGGTHTDLRQRKFKLIEAEDGTVSLKRDGREGWSAL